MQIILRLSSPVNRYVTYERRWRILLPAPLTAYIYTAYVGSKKKHPSCPSDGGAKKKLKLGTKTNADITTLLPRRSGLTFCDAKWNEYKIFKFCWKCENIFDARRCMKNRKPKLKSLKNPWTAAILYKFAVVVVEKVTIFAKLYGAMPSTSYECTNTWIMYIHDACIR